jgi:lia operon protein LiaG
MENNRTKNVLISLGAIVGGIAAVAALVVLGSWGAAARGPAAGTTADGGKAAPSGVVDQRASAPLDGIGSVTIVTTGEPLHLSDGPGNALEARLHGRAGRAPKLVVERSGEAVTVRLDRPEGIGSPWSDLALDVSLPSGYAGRLSATTTSGRLEVDDHSYAGADIVSTSGEIKVGALSAADVNVRTTSGAIRVESLRARRAELSSTSGSVEAAVQGGDTTARTTSGAVKLTFAAVPSLIDAESTSGSVRLQLPAGASFTLDASSTSGSVSCDFPVTIPAGADGRARHALDGVVGSGGNAVRARTVSGSIRIER